MSTINRMLASLEARAAETGGAALHAAVRALPEPRKHGARRALLAAALLAALALAAWDASGPGRGAWVDSAPSVVAMDAARVAVAPGVAVPTSSVEPGGEVEAPAVVPAEPATAPTAPAAVADEASAAPTGDRAAQIGQASASRRTAARPASAGTTAKVATSGPSGAARATPRSGAVEANQPAAATDVAAGRRTGGDAPAMLARRGADALASGHARLAATWLRESLGSDDAQPQVHLDLATALMHENDTEGALHHVRRAVALWGDVERAPPQARRVLAMTHARRREWDLALRAADIEHAAEDSTLLAVRAAVQVELGRWDDALAAYERLSAAAPREARWWLGLATAQQALGRWDRAGESLHQAARHARDTAVLAAVQTQLGALGTRARAHEGGGMAHDAPRLAARERP